ncbi:hypothetical protein [Pseudomonas aeruginosa]|uniref:hypothetical protein n=1 Tax=Pseudomonas aeruginosa TaxID=287 RepID=UPI003CF0B9CB
MTFVDWKVAPDGAEAFHPAAREQIACWYKRDSSGDVWCNLAEGAYLGIWTHMGGRRDFPIGAMVRSEE